MNVVMDLEENATKVNQHENYPDLESEPNEMI